MRLNARTSDNSLAKGAVGGFTRRTYSEEGTDFCTKTKDTLGDAVSPQGAHVSWGQGAVEEGE